MPWITLHLPQLPGTDIEISFIEYEAGIVEKWITQMKPNATSIGITGISECEIEVEKFNECVNFLKQVFPTATATGTSLTVPLEHGLLKVSAGSSNFSCFRIKSKPPWQQIQLRKRGGSGSIVSAELNICAYSVARTESHQIHRGHYLLSGRTGNCSYRGDAIVCNIIFPSSITNVSVPNISSLPLGVKCQVM